MQQRDWYDTPLYYDIVFDADTVREADFLEAMHRRHGAAATRSRSVLEPACGTGRLVRAMHRRGWNVSGFDANPRSLTFARQQLDATGRRVRLWENRMESFSLPARRRFDLAHCLVSTFKYLPTETAALACLRRIADSLKPGGLFVLGLHLTDYAATRPHHERWVARRGPVEVVCNTRTWPADRRNRLEDLRCRLKVTHTRRSPAVHTQETRWQFRTYDAAQLRRLLRKVPELALVACHDFHCDPAWTRELDDGYSDIILILRRRTHPP